MSDNELLPGPSSYGRIWACPRSEAEKHFPSSPKKHTELGTVMHTFFADCLTLGREEALARAPLQHYEALASIDISKLPAFDPEAYKPEVWIAVNLKTRKSRVLGYNLTREDARAMAVPGEVVCGLDILGLTEDAVVVLDYKTGRGHVEAAETNKQLRTYGAAAAIHYGKNRVIYGVIRQPPFSNPWWEMAEMDELAIEQHWSELEDKMAERDRLRALAREGRRDELPPPVVGEQCTYCPAQRGCEAWIRLAFNVPSPLDFEGKSREEIGMAYVEHKQRGKAHEIMDAFFRSVATEEDPIPLPGGQMYGPRKENHETINPEQAEKVLAERYGAALARVVMNEAVDKEPTLSKIALRSSLSTYLLPTLPGEVITNVFDDVLQAFRDARASIPRVETKWKTFKPPVEKKKKK